MKWIFPFIDKNSDGKIDSDEYQAIQEYKKKHRRDWMDRARKELGLTRISHRYFDFLSFELLQRPLLLIKDALKAIVSNNVRIDRHLILYLGSFAALESMTEPFGQAR